MLQMALPYVEPLIHFALAGGNRSDPPLRCYSPGNIDMELLEAARNFLRNGGLVVDAERKTASTSSIIRWYRPGTVKMKLHFQVPMFGMERVEIAISDCYFPL